MRLTAAACLLSCLLLTACSSVDVEDYASNLPRMQPEEFFSGSLVAHGVVKDRSGEVFRRFSADIEARWAGDTGTLEEDFHFDDGEIDRRVWTLRRNSDGSYTGTAGDVVGEGHARVAGNAMFLQYTLRVPWRDSTIDVDVDDRMYLIDESVLINESIMTKFGFRVGTILLTIRRLQDSSPEVP